MLNTIEISTPDQHQPIPKFELNSRHMQAMALRFSGKKFKDIAPLVGRSESVVKHWFASDGCLWNPYKQYCDKLMNPVPAMTNTEAVNVADRLKQVAPKALENVINLANSAKREQVKAQCNFDILDRAGYAPVQKQINVHAVEELSMNDLTSLVDGILGTHGFNIDTSVQSDSPVQLNPEAPIPLDTVIGQSSPIDTNSNNNTPSNDANNIEAIAHETSVGTDEGRGVE